MGKGNHYNYGRKGKGGGNGDRPRNGAPADLSHGEKPGDTDGKDPVWGEDLRLDGKPVDVVVRRPAEKKDSPVAGRGQGVPARPSGQNRQAARKIYEIQGIDLSAKADRNAAMAEFNMLRDKAQLHYTDFAAQEVHYDRLDDPDVTEKLKQANDAYTMSMFMNCVGPLRSGVTVGTLFQSWFSYKMIQTINPTMDMDMARMCANLKRDLDPMYDELRRQHPLLGKALSPVIGSLDGYLAAQSASKFTSGINRSMEQGKLDETIMTAKQAAALKVAFMEQYYVDLRSGERPAKQLDADYQAAVDHIRIIANNSGYDMAVVAAEERCLVGVKMKADPRYACMFEETSDLYGPHPALEADGTWAGRFETPDHHEYTVGGDASTGAFTVRRPMRDRAMDEFDRNVSDHGKQIGSMYAWLESDECPLGRVVRSRIRNHLDGYVSEYRKDVARQLVDDGIVRSARQADSYVQERFDDVVDHTRERGGLSTDCQTLQMEMRRIVTKEVLAKAGLPVTEETLAAVEGNQRCEALDPLARYAELRAHSHGDKDLKVEGCEAARQMRDNYLVDMTPEELSRLLLHAGTNIQQGIKAHGHANLFRDGKAFTFEESVAPAIHDPSFNPTRHQDGTYPPAPPPDDDEPQDETDGGPDGPEA